MKKDAHALRTHARALSKGEDFLFADFEWMVTKSANFGGESGCIFQDFCVWPPSGGWAAKLAIKECFCCVEMHVGSDDSCSRASKSKKTQGGTPGGPGQDPPALVIA